MKLKHIAITIFAAGLANNVVANTSTHRGHESKRPITVAAGDLQIIDQGGNLKIQTAPAQTPGGTSATKTPQPQATPSSATPSSGGPGGQMPPSMTPPSGMGPAGAGPGGMGPGGSGPGGMGPGMAPSGMGSGGMGPGGSGPGASGPGGMGPGQAPQQSAPSTEQKQQSSDYPSPSGSMKSPHAYPPEPETSSS